MGLKGKVIEKLRSIEEPEIGKDIISLNMVYNINIDNQKKKLTAKFRPKTFDCTVGIQLSLIVKMALMEIEELKEIELEVTDYCKAKAANKYLKNLDNNLIRRF
jgi:metal-sulfur cluster biosynthetic enzyme